MSNSKQNSATPTRPTDKHVKLFIPGPTEVRPEILDAQTEWMYGHRMPECIELMGSIQSKLRQVFLTQHRVFITASSGTGMWEAAVRNCVGKKVLNCVSGAFSSRWEQVARANGKENSVLDVEWGQPVRPEQVADALAQDEFDAVAVVHNETSTGVLNPIKEIAEAIRQSPNGENITIMVDSVSGLSGARLETDGWDLDVVLTSSQKAFALPPGLAFCAVSDKAMAKAKTVENRGYYFDFLTLEKYLVKDQTPATPAISLLMALNVQLEAMMAETMNGRFARHIAMRDLTQTWAKARGFAPFAAAGYESPTVSNFHNNLNIDINALNSFLRERGMIISNGYGNLKGKAFRISHMGDIQPADLEALFANIDDYLNNNK